MIKPGLVLSLLLLTANGLGQDAIPTPAPTDVDPSQVTTIKTFTRVFH